MGSSSAARCPDCAYQFTVSDGGGFTFHQLRCASCGRAKNIGFDELGDLHLRYLKGSATPYSVAFANEHQYVREHLDIESISSEDYYAGVEAAATCDCGGALSFSAPPRCPKCGSCRIEEGAAFIQYD
jgi:predicted Zn-ribbon and HTH transcriptional regulator